MPTAPTHWDDGRSFNFGDISSHGIAAVEVYKSTNSSLPSGGIGSTINMVTTKPLDIEGQLTSVSFDLLSDETNDDNELQPEFNFVHSSNKGNWGWSVSGSFQDRTNFHATQNWHVLHNSAQEKMLHPHSRKSRQRKNNQNTTKER